MVGFQNLVVVLDHLEVASDTGLAIAENGRWSHGVDGCGGTGKCRIEDERFDGHCFGRLVRLLKE